MVFSFLAWAAPVWAATGFTAMVLGSCIILGRALLVYGAGYALLSNTGLPTLAASFMWRYLSKATLLSVPVLAWPLAAFALFYAKVGATAHLWFAAYWLLIPALFAICSKAQRQTHLFKGILASLMAHSVGSLIVLYAGFNLAWATLVPLVFFERLVASLGMTGMAYSYDFVRSVMSTKGHHRA